MVSFETPNLTLHSGIHFEIANYFVKFFSTFIRNAKAIVDDKSLLLESNI